ncbi:hypothetical protein [Streptomyces aureus]|uniref:hypothetical protein n=1 Tax=Streptomyces aureus TaxID=193461 RepID=UPI00131CFDB2|nr:hypothetical protein [Streptomyces aureus]
MWHSPGLICAADLGRIAATALMVIPGTFAVALNLDMHRDGASADRRRPDQQQFAASGAEFEQQVDPCVHLARHKVT